MTDACMECHEPIQVQIEQERGLHGSLETGQASQCALCHGEHYGSDFPLVNVRSFALAGVEDPLAFDHALVGYTMGGAHLELECSDCHVNALAKTLAEGETRYLGLRQDCASCHADPHEGRMARACADCHGEETFDAFAPTDHGDFLALIGGHAALECRSCHAQSEEHALEALGHARASPVARECAACHASSHREAFVDAIGALVEASPGAGCVHCHAAEHVEFAAARETTGATEHALSGFPLAAPHDEATCAECHSPEAEAFAERYPGRALEACSVCHADPHAGQFARGPFAKQECTACHEAQRFEPHAFTPLLHALASLPLDGRHAEAECNACHVDAPEGVARVFHGTSSECESCHADAHRGFFDGLEPELSTSVHGTCAACHGSADFSELPASFDHERWTGFSIRGAHAQADCESCHARAELPDERGRTFGRVSERYGAFEGCVTCHADPHAGRFDQPTLPCDIAGREGCARCHTESSFRAAAESFDHGQWTGYLLDGAHAALGCTDCHAPLRKRDAHGRTWAPAAGSKCADCHADVHAGQFAEKERTDCSRCHESTTSFSELSFDHEHDARFALGEAHGTLACAACHKPWSDSSEVVRYRPVPRECAECHGRQDDPLRRRKGRKG